MKDLVDFIVQHLIASILIIVSFPSLNLLAFFIIGKFGQHYHIYISLQLIVARKKKGKRDFEIKIATRQDAMASFGRGGDLVKQQSSEARWAIILKLLNYKEVEDNS